MSAAFLLTILTCSLACMPPQGLPMVEETPYRYVTYVPIIDGPLLSQFYAPECSKRVRHVGLVPKKLLFGATLVGNLAL